MKRGRRDVLIGGSELAMVYIYKYLRPLLLPDGPKNESLLGKGSFF